MVVFQSVLVCFFLNSHHLASFTLVKFVIGKYSWQTKCSIAALVVSVGVSFVSRSVNAVMTSGPASWNVFKHASFLFPAKLPVLSAPLKAWNPTKTAVLLGPRALTMGRSGMMRCLCPTPVTNAVSSHNSGYRLSARTNTSVSGEFGG